MSTTSSCSQRSTAASMLASTAAVLARYSLSVSGVGTSSVDMVVRIDAMLKRRHSLASRVITMTAAGSLFAALSALSACGQKGPLTLPKPAPAASSSAASAPSPSASK
ncbi:LPS translocon maturation chaperone LptM [Piscinibacter sp.]|uniref:LPS translocon maturation chaperone LptM n=1 Tax=Piscinibacter sp. TaxID=1903157 RepID=UPI00355A84EF